MLVESLNNIKESYKKIFLRLYEFSIDTESAWNSLLSEKLSFKQLRADYYNPLILLLIFACVVSISLKYIFSGMEFDSSAFFSELLKTTLKEVLCFFACYFVSIMAETTSIRFFTKNNNIPLVQSATLVTIPVCLLLVAQVLEMFWDVFVIAFYLGLILDLIFLWVGTKKMYPQISEKKTLFLIIIFGAIFVAAKKWVL